MKTISGQIPESLCWLCTLIREMSGSGKEKDEYENKKCAQVFGQLEMDDAEEAYRRTDSGLCSLVDGLFKQPKD